MLNTKMIRTKIDCNSVGIVQNDLKNIELSSTTIAM